MNNLFAEYIKCDNFIFKHAKGVSDSSGKEFHLFHEIILFLGGEAELISETVHTKLKPQTLIVIPKESYHQVIITGKQDEYHRCIFQFDETGEMRTLIENSMQELFVAECDKYISYLFSKTIQSAKNAEEDFSVSIAQSVLVLLLDEIRAKKSLNNDIYLNDTLTRQAIEYISERLTENVRIEDIAQRFNVSVSTLVHTFKKNMNIPIYKYILKKRLILAHTKISNGELPSVAAVECGFNDYSGFYRQYKKMFDISPSKHTRK